MMRLELCKNILKEKEGKVNISIISYFHTKKGGVILARRKMKLSRGARKQIALSKNNTVMSNNELGIRNVQKTPSGRYQARTSVLGKQFNLTTFDTPEEASASLKGAEKVCEVLREKGVLK